MRDKKSENTQVIPVSFIKRNSHKFLLAFFILLIVFSSFMTLRAFRTPAVLSEDVTKKRKTQRISYDYRVYPAASTLYPRGSDSLPPGHKSYFYNITNRIEFEIVGEIETFNTPEPEGDLNVRLILRSPDQWEKEIDYVPQAIVDKPDKGKLVFRSTFNVPLSLAMQLSETIMDEIGVRSRDACNLVIQSTIDSPPLEGSDDSDDAPLVGEYVFALKGSTIEPSGELLFEKEETVKETLTRANYLKLWSYSLDVSRARIVFPFLQVLSLLGFGLHLFLRRRAYLSTVDKSVIELERIKRRYSGRIIEIGGLRDIPESSLKIEVENFEELVRIADERERPILQLSPKNQHDLDFVQFYIVDVDTLYSHRIMTV
jgi:hypothetical protein